MMKNLQNQVILMMKSFNNNNKLLTINKNLFKKIKYKKSKSFKMIKK